MTRRGRLVLLVLMLVAFGLRLRYLQINPLLPQFSDADDGDYYRRALRFAVTGQYVDDAWLIRPPFHVWVFAGMLRAALEFGGSPAIGVRLIQALQVALGVAMVPLCYALAARLFNPRAGLIFAGFWAIWFPFVELPSTLFSEPIYLFLWTLHVWLLVRWDDQQRTRDLVLSGLALGAAALTRSPALYALAFVVPWLVWRELYRVAGPAYPLPGDGEGKTRPSPATPAPRGFPSVADAGQTPSLRPSPVGMGEAQGVKAFGFSLLRASIHALRPLTILAAATLVVVLPWTLRNWVVYHQVIPVDTLGQVNLWLDLGATDERNAKINELRALPQAERAGYAMGKAREILAQDPMRPFRQMWPNFRHIWKAQFVEDYFVKRSFFARPLREAAPLGLLGDMLWLVFVFAGLVGILHPATGRPFKIVMVLWLIYSIFTVIVFHVEPRYLLGLWLLIALYGAPVLGGYTSRRSLLRRSPVRAALIAAALVALAALFVTYRNYPEFIARGTAREWHMRRGEQAFARGDYPAAGGSFRAALVNQRSFADAEVALARVLGAEGRPEEAIGVLTPGASRRTRLVDGALRRQLGQLDQARALLRPVENTAGEDAQRWSLHNLRPEPRWSVVLGDDALDLGYVAGFSEGERLGDRTLRWLLGDGVVTLPLPTAVQPGDSVALDLATPLDLNGTLDVHIGDRLVGRLSVVPGWRRYHLPVPPDLVGTSQLELRLHAPTRIPMRDDPASNDPRPLSVMVHRVAVE